MWVRAVVLLILVPVYSLNSEMSYFEDEDEDFNSFEENEVKYSEDVSSENDIILAWNHRPEIAKKIQQIKRQNAALHNTLENKVLQARAATTKSTVFFKTSPTREPTRTVGKLVFPNYKVIALNLNRTELATVQRTKQFSPATRTETSLSSITRTQDTKDKQTTSYEPRAIRTKMLPYLPTIYQNYKVIELNLTRSKVATVQGTKQFSTITRTPTETSLSSITRTQKTKGVETTAQSPATVTIRKMFPYLPTMFPNYKVIELNLTRSEVPTVRRTKQYSPDTRTPRMNLSSITRTQKTKDVKTTNQEPSRTTGKVMIPYFPNYKVIPLKLTRSEVTTIQRTKQFSTVTRTPNTDVNVSSITRTPNIKDKETTTRKPSRTKGKVIVPYFPNFKVIPLKRTRSKVATVERPKLSSPITRTPSESSLTMTRTQKAAKRKESNATTRETSRSKGKIIFPNYKVIALKLNRSDVTKVQRTKQILSVTRTPDTETCQCSITGTQETKDTESTTQEPAHNMTPTHSKVVTVQRTKHFSPVTRTPDTTLSSITRTQEILKENKQRIKTLETTEDPTRTTGKIRMFPNDNIFEEEPTRSILATVQRTKQTSEVTRTSNTVINMSLITQETKDTETTSEEPTRTTENIMVPYLSSLFSNYEDFEQGPTRSQVATVQITKQFSVEVTTTPDTETCPCSISRTPEIKDKEKEEYSPAIIETTTETIQILKTTQDIEMSRTKMDYKYFTIPMRTLIWNINQTFRTMNYGNLNGPMHTKKHKCLGLKTFQNKNPGLPKKIPWNTSYKPGSKVGTMRTHNLYWNLLNSPTRTSSMDIDVARFMWLYNTLRKLGLKKQKKLKEQESLTKSAAIDDVTSSQQNDYLTNLGLQKQQPTDQQEPLKNSASIDDSASDQPDEHLSFYSITTLSPRTVHDSVDTKQMERSSRITNVTTVRMPLRRVSTWVPGKTLPVKRTSDIKLPSADSLKDQKIVAKCYVCGLTSKHIPDDSNCSDAFQSREFFSLEPYDPRVKRQATKFKRYCKYYQGYPWPFEHPEVPHTVFGEFTEGCAVRWTDAAGIYTQRTCRIKHNPIRGNHLASKRMAQLEFLLRHSSEGCIESPMATLLPLSRTVSLFARFHACVCEGTWCNHGGQVTPNMAAIMILFCRCWFSKLF